MKNRLNLHILLIFCCASFTSSCTSSNSQTSAHRSENLITIRAQYIGWTCGPHTPQVMPVENVKGLNHERLKYGFRFYTASNIETPDNFEATAVPGNIFELTGYYYYTFINNTKYLHQRFDLISWHPIPPFRIWGANAQYIEVTSNKGYQFGLNKLQNEDGYTLAHKYDPC